MNYTAEIDFPTLEGQIISPIYEGRLQVGAAMSVTYSNSIDLSFTAGEDLTTGDVVYILGNSVLKASQSNTNYEGKVTGVIVNTVLEGAVALVRVKGTVTKTGWGLTPNSIYYLGDAGLITATKPSNSGFVLQVGIAKTSTTLEVNLVYQRRAERIRLVNANPSSPTEGEICLNVSDDKLYLANTW
jgi:hypothetical protein